jgi:hypothetical protein
LSILHKHRISRVSSRCFLILGVSFHMLIIDT